MIKDGGPLQQISDQLEVTIRELDLELSANDLATTLTQLAREPFRLDAAPLFRVNVLRLSATEHVLQIVIHHIISDGWSVDLLFAVHEQD